MWISAFRLLTVATVATLVSSCSGEDTAKVVDTTGASSPGVSFSLEDSQDAGLVGARAILVPLDANRTRIEIDGIAEGAPSGGGPRRGELVTGPCNPEIDQVKRVQLLGKIVDDATAATVPLGLADLTGGDYAVSVWVTSEPRMLIACAEIPSDVSTTEDSDSER